MSHTVNVESGEKDMMELLNYYNIICHEHVGMQVIETTHLLNDNLKMDVVLPSKVYSSINIKIANDLQDEME